ncbi:hypothetical protein BJX61DRAFT_375576 [Aspergillus egyptiacus]|nr:hypothetical protein BJX61DRAFT_375576 [Aspergillus egyptiacus]
MDPVSAIGLASNMLQFVEFGIRLCDGIHQVANSTTGLTEDNTHISVVAEDLRQATDRLSVSVKGNSRHELGLINLARECQDLSDELSDIFSKLKPTKGDHLWSSVRVAWKSALKQKKIASIEKRLADYRAQIVLRLNLLLYEQQSPITQCLKSIQKQAIELGNQHCNQLQKQNEQLTDVLQRLETMHVGNSAISVSAASAAVVNYIQSPLTTPQLDAKQIPKENEILRSLYFPSMFSRNNTISHTMRDTYRWLVAKDLLSRVSDKSRLQMTANQNCNPGNGEASKTDAQESSDVTSRQPGDKRNERENYRDNPECPVQGEEQLARQGVAFMFQSFLLQDYSTFFIHGKAGSGKSTLMKFIADPDNLNIREHLQSWAGSSRLIFVSVSFKIAGDNLQSSLEGLYRSILYQVLRQCPALISEVFEHTSAISSWEGIRFSLLKRAMKKLAQNLDTQPYSLCLLIDGLDEYRGDSYGQGQLAKDIQDWVQHKHIKIICSARPHLEYMQIFNDQTTSLSLCEPTRGDILEYAVTVFRASTGTPTRMRPSLRLCIC